MIYEKPGELIIQQRPVMEILLTTKWKSYDHQPTINKREEDNEELMHAILYVTHFESSDFVGQLYRNESFVGVLAELIYQVNTQVNN